MLGSEQPKTGSEELNFKDYAIIIGLTLGMLALVPLIAVLGFAAQFGFVALMPIILVGGVIHAFATEAEVVVTQVQGVQIPSDIRLHARHGWARRAQPTCVVTGADDFAQRLLGPVEEVLTTATGTRVREGDVIAILRRGNRELAVRAPMDGTVSGINPVLAREPGVVNTSPYGRGWLVELTSDKAAVKPSLKKLLGGGKAVRWMRNEVDRLVALTTPAELAHTMADGGELTSDVSTSLDDDTWNRVNSAFFS